MDAAAKACVGCNLEEMTELNTILELFIKIAFSNDDIIWSVAGSKLVVEPPGESLHRQKARPHDHQPCSQCTGMLTHLYLEAIAS